MLSSSERSRSAIARKVSAVGLSCKLSGMMSSQRAYSSCSVTSSVTASFQRWGLERRSAGLLNRTFGLPPACISRKRACRSAFVIARSFKGLRPAKACPPLCYITKCNGVEDVRQAPICPTPNPGVLRLPLQPSRMVCRLLKSHLKAQFPVRPAGGESNPPPTGGATFPVPTPSGVAPRARASHPKGRSAAEHPA
jgi:hypothetical protein